MDRWLCLWEDSQVPHHLDLVSLVDLALPCSGPQTGLTLEFLPLRRGGFTLTSQRPSVRESPCKMDGWVFRLSEVGHGPHQLVLDGLVDLDVDVLAS
jgi:hypothetical protein